MTDGATMSPPVPPLPRNADVDVDVDVDEKEDQNERHEPTPLPPELLTPSSKGPRNPTAKAAKDGDAGSSSSRVERLYEFGKESARRRRLGEGRTPEQQGCTFKPRINSSRRRDPARSPRSPVSDASRFDTLYEQGVAHRARLEASKKLAERANTPSFKPKINSSQAGRPANAATTNDQEGSARFEKLYAQAMEQRKALEERQKRAVDAECTFRPQTWNGPRKIKGDSPKSTSPSSPATRQERLNELYNHAKQVEEKRKKMAERLASEYTFTPRTNASLSARNTPRRSLDSLYPDPAETAARAAELESIRQLREMEGCTFAPSLETRGYGPPQSPALSGRRLSASGADAGETAANAMDVHARLYEQALVKTKQRRSAESSQALVGAHSSSSSASVAALSAVSPSGRRLSHDSAEKLFSRLYQHGKDWAQKKAREDEAAQQRREEREWAANADECTFKPNIPHSSRAMAQRAERGSEVIKHDGTIFERLYAQSVEKRAKQRMGAADRLGLDYACTFQPRINATSKMLAQRRHSTGVSDRERIIRSRLEAQRASARAGLPEDDVVDPLVDPMERMGLSSANRHAAVDFLTEEAEEESVQSISSRELMASVLAEDARDHRFNAMREESWDTAELLDS
ncbi:Hypothetical Protein FCC1311_047222 [Hondaea fermentalgiana]|uniref:Uncharacterized protein n=1 Tax=Hondaea fermentalgiana TaxID=2315210 RepID=A0A2R5GDT7_9STRA|nr:Hypothetical Protein FCC1311_047222 [Hondaea fermentalgiana]|eukprot:GBG28499.1 Hypothetical Protein FCC1311_047222 [Hondaea fermentalgiana]